ncbi:MAG: hypothetical protein ACI9N9_003026 [Enterobacterales bacterium]|jgi:hypothetical protein
MMKKVVILITLISSAILTGCASVPMETLENDKFRKEFSSPSKELSGLYIYRNTNFGGALKKSIYIDGKLIGESAPMTYFYRDIQPGKHELSTESEFSENNLIIEVKAGLNYFINQYIKLGVFVGGAGLELVSEEEGKKGVLETKLAK